MKLLKSYELILGVLILILVAAVIIWWLMKKVDDSNDSCTTPSGHTTYFTARGSECPLNTNYLWWEANALIDSPVAYVSLEGVIDPKQTGMNKTACQQLTLADYERICTANDNCIGWAARACPNFNTDGGDNCLFYMKDTVKFGPDSLKYTCNQHDVPRVPGNYYTFVGQFKNNYLTKNNLHPKLVTGPGGVPLSSPPTHCNPLPAAPEK